MDINSQNQIEFTSDAVNEVVSKLRETIDSQKVDIDLLRAQLASKADEVRNYDDELRLRESELIVKNKELENKSKELDAKTKELGELARDSCELRSLAATAPAANPQVRASDGIGLFWAEAHLQPQLSHVINSAANLVGASRQLQDGVAGSAYPLVILTAMPKTSRVSLEVNESIRSQCKSVATKMCVLVCLRMGANANRLTEKPSGVDELIELYMDKTADGLQLVRCPGNDRGFATLKDIVKRTCPPPPRQPAVLERTSWLARLTGTFGLSGY